MVLMPQVLFAERCGVTKQTINKACRVGNKLEFSKVNDRINILSPQAMTYVKKRKLDITKWPEFPEVVSIPSNNDHPSKKAAYKRQQEGKTVKEPGEQGSLQPDIIQAPIPKHILDVADLPFRQVVEMWPTDRYMVDYLKALKEIEAITEKRLKNQETQGESVSREMVSKHIFAYLSGNQERMVQDAPRAIVARVTAAHDAGESLEDLTRIVRDLISKYLQEGKEKVKKGIEGV